MSIVGIDSARAARTSLEELALDDDLSILHLWDSVVEEFGERALGDANFDDSSPTSLSELAVVFEAALRS